MFLVICSVFRMTSSVLGRLVLGIASGSLLSGWLVLSPCWRRALRCLPFLRDLPPQYTQETCKGITCLTIPASGDPQPRRKLIGREVWRGECCWQGCGSQSLQADHPTQLASPSPTSKGSPFQPMIAVLNICSESAPPGGGSRPRKWTQSSHGSLGCGKELEEDAPHTPQKLKGHPPYKEDTTQVRVPPKYTPRLIQLQGRDCVIVIPVGQAALLFQSGCLEGER